MTIPIDALVRGEVGHTTRVETMRVFHRSPFGWVAGVTSEGRQRIMHAPEVIDRPRPEKQRTDVPDRLK
jgi:hypothetical protein